MLEISSHDQSLPISESKTRSHFTDLRQIMDDLKRSQISIGVRNAIIENQPAKRHHINWAGFADAKPSESIQKHDLPGLAVTALFPIKIGEELLVIPTKQFKDERSIQKKIRAAEKLTEWLSVQREEGLKILGFCLTQTQITAANYGLRLIEELPGVYIDAHYDSYRVFFADHHIDFAQAVALEYYMFSALFGMLLPSKAFTDLDKTLVLYMDRFPAASIGDVNIGDTIPKTDGMKFIEYVIENSSTYRKIIEDHRSNSIETIFKTLDYWSPLGSTDVREGKTHPHFILPDWLAAASIATEYRGEFVASYSSHAKAVRLADSCENLYNEFKKFNIMSLDDKVLSHIIGGESVWTVPDEAREYIINRASR
ncbi:MAG: hypothetical protein JAZ17_05570 [Candidatus Thiodiazotropha endolucinida]|nr:hypothetical protein [Candidatus Thiodiazotropha endolucinida]